MLNYTTRGSVELSEKLPQEWAIYKKKSHTEQSYRSICTLRYAVLGTGSCLGSQCTGGTGTSIYMNLPHEISEYGER